MSVVAQVAAVPDEHGRLIERLASAVATSFSEAPALVLQLAQESSLLERGRSPERLVSHGHLQGAALSRS